MAGKPLDPEVLAKLLHQCDQFAAANLAQFTPEAKAEAESPAPKRKRKRKPKRPGYCGRGSR